MNMPRGAKWKITKERIKDICDAIRAGQTKKDAAIYSGIAEGTFYKWLSEGAIQLREIQEGIRVKRRTRQIELIESIAQAEADLKAGLLAAWVGMAVDDWRATEAFLKRRFPDEFGDKIKQDITTGGRPIRIKEIIMEIDGGEGDN
jgi:hypothetical protein